MKFLIPFFALLLISCETLPKVYRSNIPSSQPKTDERTEYAELIEIDQKEKLQRAAEAVTQFINESPNDPNAAVLIKNETNCNIIVRISGANGNYRIHVAQHDKNYIVLKKGSYTFTSSFCEARYFSDKTLTESITLTLTENYR